MDAVKIPQSRGINHVAWRCRDAEQTRWFYEDILGLKLTMALAFDQHSGMDEDRMYMHLFFDTGDGSHIAFFDDPDFATKDHFKKTDGFETHIAFNSANRDDLLVMQKRIQDAGISCFGPIDHDFLESIYAFDPNGLQIEFTCPTPKHEEIVTYKEGVAHENVAEWTERTRAQKVELFGATKLDYRGKPGE